MAKDLELEALRGKPIMLTGEPSSRKFSNWKPFIWKLMILNKIKLFLWRATSNIFPYRKVLWAKHVIPSSLCRLCSRDEEFVLHAL